MFFSLTYLLLSISIRGRQIIMPHFCVFDIFIVSATNFPYNDAQELFTAALIHGVLRALIK